MLGELEPGTGNGIVPSFKDLFANRFLLDYRHRKQVLLRGCDFINFSWAAARAGVRSNAINIDWFLPNLLHPGCLTTEGNSASSSTTP